MKRQVVTLAIAVAVLAILAVMLTVFLLTEPPQQEPLADSKVPLFNLGEVWTSITVENAQGGYVMEHQGEAVAIQGLEELSLNEDLISRTVDIAVAPSAEREIRDVSNLENFGLEPARAVVTIEAEQGQQTFSIGSATPVDQGYYLLFENRVYLAAQEMVEPSLFSLWESLSRWKTVKWPRRRNLPSRVLHQWRWNISRAREGRTLAPIA